MAASASTVRAVGRPRDERVDAAIRAATIELLMEAGYNTLSIEAVARRSGTSKRTIYRRWPSKAHLVHAAVFSDVRLPEATGDLAADLRQMVAGTIANFSQPEARSAIPGLMSEFRDDPALHDILTARLERQARADFRALVGNAIARGDARPGVDPDLVFDLIAGTVLFTVNVSRREPGSALVDGIVDLLLHAVSTR